MAGRFSAAATWGKGRRQCRLIYLDEMCKKTRMPFLEPEGKTNLPSITDGLIYLVLQRLVLEYRVL
jgi:hypothetical protein